MTLREQLVLAIVNKGIIALMLMVAGFWFNRYLEAFKGRQALENELRTIRDQKQIELLQSQLSQFYWPVYLRLQMDNVVWEKILQRQSADPIESELGHRIENDFILPNHETICGLIQANIHLAAPNSELMNAILRYLKHIAVYRALRAGGSKKDPYDVGEAYPREFFPAIESATIRKQQDFEALLNRFAN